MLLFEYRHSLSILGPLMVVSSYRDVKLEYKTLKEKMKEYNKKDAKFYSNIFAKMSKLEPTEASVSTLYLRKLNNHEINAANAHK